MDSYPADYMIFHDTPPAEVDGNGGRHWYARGQNFVLAYSDCIGSMTTRRAGQPDEWMLLLPGRDTRARISAGACVVATALFFATALPTYAFAWHKTGKPLFPFLNTRIHSPPEIPLRGRGFSVIAQNRISTSRSPPQAMSRNGQ